MMSSWTRTVLERWDRPCCDAPLAVGWRQWARIIGRARPPSIGRSFLGAIQNRGRLSPKVVMPRAACPNVSNLFVPAPRPVTLSRCCHADYAVTLRINCHAEGECAYSIVKAWSRPKRLGWINSRYVLNSLARADLAPRRTYPPHPLPLTGRGSKAVVARMSLPFPPSLHWQGRNPVTWSGAPGWAYPLSAFLPPSLEGRGAGGNRSPAGHVSGGVKNVSSSTGSAPGLRRPCSTPIGTATICPARTGVSTWPSQKKPFPAST